MTAATPSELMTTPVLAPVRALADEATRWRSVSIDAGATVREARDLVRATGQDVLVVTSHSHAVGIITKAELWALGTHAPHDRTVIENILAWELVQLRPEFDVDHTLRRYRNAAWASLVRRRPERRDDRRPSCAC